MCPTLVEARGFCEIGTTPHASSNNPFPIPRADARMPRFLSRSGSPDATRLQRLEVALIGAGAVGRNVALHLARLAPATLWIVDPGRYKPESLLTQTIGPDDVGQSKALNVARLCKAISPATRVRAFEGSFEALETTALLDAGLVVLATDNLRAEVQVGQRCIHLQRPLVQASVHGDTLTSQLRFFSNASAAGPCPACGFTAEEWTHLNRSTSFSCEGHRVTTGRATAKVETQPTTSVSFLCSLAADLALMQILRHALGLGAPVVDTVLEYSGYTHRTVASPLKRNPRCPAEHLPWRTATAGRPLADSTLRELAQAAGFAGDDTATRAAFYLGELFFLEWGVCHQAHSAPVGRFVAPGESIGSCPCCAGPVRPHPFHSHRPASGRLLDPLLDRPLSEIAPATPAWAVVRGEDEAVLLRNGDQHKEEPDR
jgi:molybdopterin/thiamine biosynthesis adenylyltransferase